MTAANGVLSAVFLVGAGGGAPWSRFFEVGYVGRVLEFLGLGLKKPPGGRPAEACP